MWPKEQAEIMKRNAGNKWRPSNGTEGEIFIGNVCGSCRIGARACLIVPEVMAHDIDSPQYPDAWHIDANGYPQCNQYDPSN